MSEFDTPLVTLIVCIYNGQKYLELCLQSIRNQTYPKIEVLLIDDGSTDASAEIAKKITLLDSRFRLITQTNHGVSYARNLGIEQACGKYVGIIDQDDYLNPKYVELFVTHLENSGAQIATSDNLIKFKGSKPSIIDVDINEKFEIISGLDAAKRMLLYILEIGPWNKLISRKLIIDNKIQFDKELYCGEGFLFSVECFQKADRAVVCHQPVYHYRIDNSTSGTSSFSTKKCDSAIRAQNLISEKNIDHSSSISNILKFSRWKTISDYYTLIVLTKNQKRYPEYFSFLKKYCRKHALIALLVPTKTKQKIRAISYFLCPLITLKYVKFKSKIKTDDKFSK